MFAGRERYHDYFEKLDLIGRCLLELERPAEAEPLCLESLARAKAAYRPAASSAR